ncbi:MAG TPA: GGDEF domain-containing protein [Euzebyales bacterium]|nr:GGDEF domain-containing protein [Euzebyales bacterium]
MRTSVPEGHEGATSDAPGGWATPAAPTTISRDAARAALYQSMIDCQMHDGERVLDSARQLADHASDRGWPDVRALAGYVVVVARWTFDRSGPWAPRNVGTFVRWAHATGDPLAIALSLIARARADLYLQAGTNPLDDLISAYVASERIATRVERAFALHEVASSLHEMRMWELATTIYEIVGRMTADLDEPRALVGGLVANRFYTLAGELLYARESGRAAAVERRMDRVAALPAIDDLGPAVPVEWYSEITAYAAICRALVHADDESAATLATLLASPSGRRSSRAQMMGLLRCVLGWHRLHHGRVADAEPLIEQGAAELLDSADATSTVRSFALWLRALVRNRAMRDRGQQALLDYHEALLGAADDARDALVKSTRARLQTEQLRAERDRFAQESLTDPLTGLANRRALESRLRDLSEGSTLIIVDIDQFKPVNDRFGHEVGDQVLRRIGQILRDCVRPGDLAARLGGDEFVLVLDTADPDVADRRGHEVRDRIRAETWPAVHPALTVEASVGVACGQFGATALYRTADEALYAAKRAGGGRVRAFVDRSASTAASAAADRASADADQG